MRSRKAVPLYLVLIVSGCAYHGAVPSVSYVSNSQFSKIEKCVFYKEHSTKVRPIQIAQGPTTYHIELAESLDSALVTMLRAHFAEVETKNVSDAQFIAEPVFIPTLRHLDSHGNAFIETNLQLQLTDARSGQLVERFETQDSISYTPPASATALQWMTGLSLFILAPATIPAMVQFAGDKAVDLAHEKIPGMVSNIESGLLTKQMQISAFASQSQQEVAAREPASSLPIARPAPRSSDVDRPIASKTQSRPNAYAIVVGIESYRSNLPKADFSAQDAKIMGEYLTNVMGYQAQNVAVLLNDRAAKADIQKYIEHWLPNRVEADAAVFVYFSGHGAPNPKTGEAYLVPFDGDPAFMEATGYPLTRLYEQLNKLPTKEVVVVLDSCFSGAGGRSVIAKGLRPIVTEVEHPMLAKGNAVVLAASAGQQASSTYEEKAHGLLTYFFLKGLQGDGDTNKDGTIELTELFQYLRPQVERVARRDFNNEQTPQLLGSAGVLERRVRLAERACP